MVEKLSDLLRELLTNDEVTTIRTKGPGYEFMATKYCNTLGSRFDTQIAMDFKCNLNEMDSDTENLPF